jgi:hypothetical protein
MKSAPVGSMRSARVGLPQLLAHHFRRRGISLLRRVGRGMYYAGQHNSYNSY